MHGPTMQCNSKTYYQMFSCLPLSLTYVLSLNRHWSWSFDQWPSAGCL